MAESQNTALPHDAIQQFCRKWKIAELYLFGSAARGELQPESDLDFLYVFEPDARWGWEIVEMQEELEAITGRAVDLVSLRAVRNGHNVLRRNAILQDALPVYSNAA